MVAVTSKRKAHGFLSSCHKWLNKTYVKDFLSSISSSRFKSRCLSVTMKTESPALVQAP